MQISVELSEFSYLVILAKDTDLFTLSYQVLYYVIGATSSATVIFISPTASLKVSLFLKSSVPRGPKIINVFWYS